MIRIISILSIALLMLPLSGEETEAEKANQSEEAKQTEPEVRPRLFNPTDMHPYRYSGMGYFDPWYHRGNYYRSYAYGYGYPYGYGMRSQLYYETRYGFLPPPGHSKLSVSLGSNDYFGTSISTSGFLNKDLGIIYNVSALWEKGETFWGKQDYDSVTIAPSFFWSNENTSIYVGFEYTETHYDEQDMSPFRAEAARSAETKHLSGRSGAWRTREASDHTVKSATIGLEHELNDTLSLGVFFESKNFDRRR